MYRMIRYSAAFLLLRAVFRALGRSARACWRFVSGAHMDGQPRTDATWTQPGSSVILGQRAGRWSHLPRLHRAGYRLAVTVGLAGTATAYYLWPTRTVRALVAAVALLAVRFLWASRSWWRNRKFRRVYVQPLAQVLAPILSIPIYTRTESWLMVSPDLAGLAPRLARPMSPAEKATREWYGEHVEPVLRWLPDRVMRGYWWARDGIAPAFESFRPPVAEEIGPRVEVKAKTYVSTELKKTVREVVHAKLGLSDLQESWDQVGPTATGTWTVRVRPPSKVGHEEVAAHIDTLKEHEFYVGMGAGDRPVIVSLDDDSPHIACSAGSGAGKSVLAMLFGIQVLRRGGQVFILDRKGSHRWARGLDGVTYCTKPADMHAALIGIASLANKRNEQAMEEEEGWDPGPRVFVIFEEMNATVAQLRAYWDSIREKSDPKVSPAITAFRDLMYMGRSAKANIFGVAQMLTASTTGGPEARENFGLRFLARYTANNWKMLAPECAMPKKSKTRGRWQVVIAGEAIEVQVAFLHAREARELAWPEAVPMSPHADWTGLDLHGPDVPTQAVPTQAGPVDDQEVPSDPGELAEPLDPFAEPITLQEAIDAGILTESYDTEKKRIQRGDPNRTPKPVGTRGRAKLYRATDLVEWSTVSAGIAEVD